MVEISVHIVRTAIISPEYLYIADFFSRFISEKNEKPLRLTFLLFALSAILLMLLAVFLIVLLLEIILLALPVAGLSGKVLGHLYPTFLQDFRDLHPSI